jgi:DNA-binding MarR family transcriptional regulator
MRLGYEGEWDSAGVSLSGILSLSDEDAGVLAWLLRRPDASVAQVAEETGLAEAAAGALLARLVGQGLLSERLLAGERRYVASAGRRRGGRLSTEMWEALREDDAAEPAPVPPHALRRTAVGEWARHRLSGERARFAAGVSPVLAVFLFAAWQATTGHLSLADVLSFLGVIIVALLAGVFPVLLLVAARRRGELPAGGYRLPAGRWVLGAVYVIALGGVALHGIALWDDPLQRAAALAVTVLALVLTVNMVRGGAFVPRATIELRADADGDVGWFSLVAAGRAVVADVVLEYADGTEQVERAASGEIVRFASLRRVTLTPQWPAGSPPELKLWAHRVTADDESEPLEAQLELDETAASSIAIVLGPRA